MYFPSSPAPTAPVPGRTVLIAEDEEPVRILVKEILENEGLFVFEAANGVEALDLWKSNAHHISLLLTDMVMPGGMSGRDLARNILADRPQLPVIYSSGYSTELFGGGMSLKEGVNYLPKPYRSSALVAIVGKALNLSLGHHS